MVERQDIDALLISALYGELTPADEARLAAHLESHPTDRSALEDLRGTREKLQQSRILTYQYDPPQSVSALLMQEASRRAPKKATEGEGWFARFVRSFIQHPAIAAAAMIVVVVGASALVSRTGDKFAETPAVETAKYDEKASEAAPAVAMEAPSAGPTGATDQFKVGLADEPQKEAEGAKQQALPEADPNVAFYDATKGGDTLGGAKAPPTLDTGLELRRRDAMPKDFDSARPDPTPAPAKNKAAEEKLAKPSERPYRGSPPADEAARNNREQTGYVSDGRWASGAGGASGGAPGVVAPTSPSAPATVPTPKPTTAAAPRNATPPRTTPPPPPPPAPQGKTAPQPRQEIATDTASTGDSRDAEKKERAADKAANDPNLAWAKDQHAALVTAVRANNCGRAANIALAIANRAPAYYAQNVETDRSVKECIAYINQERERDAEVRASRAKKSQLKAAEPAAPKRAADQPSRATSTEQSK